MARAGDAPFAGSLADADCDDCGTDVCGLFCGNWYLCSMFSGTGPTRDTRCIDYLPTAFTFHGDGRLTELRVSRGTSEPEYCEHASGDWTFVEGGDVPAALAEECASLDPSTITGTLTMDREHLVLEGQPNPEVVSVCTLFDGRWLWMNNAGFLRGEGVNVGSCEPSGGSAGTGGGGASNDLSCSTPGQMSVPGC